MKIKKITSILLVLVLLISSISLSAFCTEEVPIKTISDFSAELEAFLKDNSKYSSLVETPDSEAGESDSIINTNRLIVSTDSNDALENYCGAVSYIEGFNNWHILQYDCEDSAITAYNYYSSQSYVNYVEFDEIIEFEEEETEIGVVETYSSDSNVLSWGADRVKSVDAMELLRKSKIDLSTVVVAVIDSGVDASHDFFIDKETNTNRILEGNRPKDNNPDPTQPNYSHGTEIAGVIVDNTPSNVKIKPYNFYYYQNGTTINLATEIKSAVEDEVDVISISLGSYTRKQMVEEEVKKAIDNGIVVVASAGNAGVDASEHYPSNYPCVISVAAFNSSNEPWSNPSSGKETNYGSSIDISAPGSAIRTTIPGGGYATDGGTSMATPFVSAAAAILKSTNKSLSPVRICEILTESAYKPSGWTNNYASNYGAGIVNFKNMLAYVTMPEPTITLGSNDKISITSAAGNNATYYYTTNGNDPTTSSTKYTGSFSVPLGAKSIKAIAVVDGIIKSSVAEYPIQYHTQITVGYKCKQKLDLPDNAKNINYSVSDKSIVSVEDGQVRGLKPGETIITVTMNANRIYYYHVSVEFTWWQFFHQIIYILFGVLI